jgi:phosphoinositide-3-kinase regulatory subunit 4
MDIFSAGCVIAEIMMDGLPLFDLARLQQFRWGSYDPSEELKKRISDQTIVALIMNMIQRDPAKRPKIE